MSARLRFTIRDLLWLTLVVALIVGWRLEYLATAKRAENATEKLQAAEATNDTLN